ncbi:MAG: T9SS type A sorting domain-containing protein, partial [Bacteroidales bacterium]
EYYFHLKLDTPMSYNYVPFDFDFEPPLAQVPDSMVFGILSTGTLADDVKPAGCELFIDNISLKGLSVQPAEFNGDFEQWQTFSLYVPQSWEKQSMDFDRFDRSTEAVQGKFALELKTISEYDGDSLVAKPGEISNGYWDESCQCQRGGMPFENTKDTLTFFYKYHPANDSAKAIVRLQFKREGDNVWYESVELEASDTYVQKNVLIEIYKYYAIPPDTVIVSIMSTDWEDRELSFVGSHLWIDNMHFRSEFYVPPVKDPSDPNLEIPNGGFEYWETKGYEYPLNYPYNTNTILGIDFNLEPSVFKTNDAVQGNWALNMITRKYHEELMTGFVLNADPNEDIEKWHGGFPINEAPTGINLHYKYFPQGNDTAVVLLAFSKEGQNLGTYVYPLTEGTRYTLADSLSYTLFDTILNPPLAQVPDSFILGFASSNVMTETYVEGSELFIDKVSFTGISAQPAQLNGDFEAWVEESIEKPLSWSSPFGTEGVFKTTEAFAGSYALELHTLFIEVEMGSYSVPGMLMSGSWNSESIEGSLPIWNLTDTLLFYYKYQPANPVDSAIFSVFLLSGEDMVNARSRYLVASDTYTLVEIPLEAQNEYWLPDNMIIMASSSLTENSDSSFAGAVLTLDEIHLKTRGWTIDIMPEPLQELEAFVYPNPGRAKVFISDPGHKYRQISIYTLTGQLILHQYKAEDQNLLELDLSGQPEGLYLIKLSSGEDKVLLKYMLRKD